MKSLYQFLLSAKKDKSLVFLAMNNGGFLSGTVSSVNSENAQINKADFLAATLQWFRPDNDVTISLSQVSFWSEKNIRPLIPLT